MFDGASGRAAVLVVAVGPSTAAWERAEADYRFIHMLVEASGGAVMLSAAPGPAALPNLLQSYRPRIAHLCAVPGALPEPDALAAALAPFAPDLECVVLAAGATEQHALALMRRVRYTLRIERAALGNLLANHFIADFYESIAIGRSIRAAFERAAASDAIAALPGMASLYCAPGAEQTGGGLEAFVSAEGSPKGVIGEAATPPRYANYEIAEPGAAPQPAAPLTLGRAYDVTVWISSEPAGQPLADDAGQRRPIRDPDSPEPVTLYVVFEPSPAFFDFDENARVRTIQLPPAGEGDSTRATITVTPKAETAVGTALADIGARIYYNFAEVESLRIKAEIVPEDDAGASRLGLAEPVRASYRKLGGWRRLDEIERRAAHFRVAALGNDRFELTLLYEGVTFKGALRLTKEEAEDAILEARELLEHLAVSQESPIRKGQNHATRSKVRELAHLGRVLWSKLFEQERDHALWRVGEFLKAHPPQPGALIQVTVDKSAAGFIFPWNLLYDRDEPASAATLGDILDGFWGMRYCVEQVTEQATAARRDAAVAITDRLRLSFMPLQGLPNWQAQQDFVAALPGRSAQIDVGAPVLARAACRALLADCDSHILYFYTRGYTRRRRADVAGLNPAAGERSYVELTAGKLYLDELEVDKRSIHLKRRPIVFLNMCEGSQVTPSLSEGFAPFFLDVDSAAVIGAECPMTTEYAHPFALAFFDGLLAGQRVGEALLGARRAFLEPGASARRAFAEDAVADRIAVLGLAYTLYGQATLRYEPAPLPAPAPIPAGAAGAAD